MNLTEVPIDKPITLLCHDGTVRITNDRPNTVEITPEATVAEARSLSREEWGRLTQSDRFLRLFRLVYADLPLAAEVPPSEQVIGVQHVTGLILLTMKAIVAGKDLMWRLPESYLHPKQQCGLADLLIFFSSLKRPDQKEQA